MSAQADSGSTLASRLAKMSAGEKAAVLEQCERYLADYLAAQDPALWMYAIQAGHLGPIKLGITRDPEGRLQELQTSNPETLRLIGAWRSFPAEEKQIHQEYADLRIRGEWFQPHPEILRLARGLAATNRGYQRQKGRWRR